MSSGSYHSILTALIGFQQHGKAGIFNRDVRCYWAAIELGIPMADPAKRLEMTLAAISYAVKRGGNSEGK